MFNNDKLYIDIRKNKFKYAQISFAGNGSIIKIKKFGTVFFSNEMVESGNPWVAGNLRRLLLNFLKKEKITAKKLFINISDPSIVIRTVEIPFMSLKDLSEYLKMEIPQYLPIDINSNIFDFKILETFTTNDDKKLMKVLIASAPKQLVENCIRVFRSVGLKPEIIDIYPNTLSRVFSKSSENVAVADLNENFIDFTIMKSGKIFMYSSVEASNPVFTDEYDIERLVNYIKTYLNFFSSRHFGTNVDMLYLFGDYELIDKLSGELTEELSIPVVPGIPESFGIKVKGKLNDKINTGECNKYLSVYMSNIGMALREEQHKL